MKELTKRQKEVLDFIAIRIKKDGYPPTIREIGSHMGIRSTNGVSDHLRALERKGYLYRDESKSRALRPIHPILSERDKKTKEVKLPKNLVQFPMLGKIAAGTPIAAIEDHGDELLTFDAGLLGRSAESEVFALTVQGDSMIDDGIFDGDIIMVRKQNIARQGEIVAAMIDGEATVKRYYPKGDEIHFEPANVNMDTIIVRRSEFRDTQILGVVVGLFRRMH